VKLRIGWLYGHEMNIYGDRGNVMALAQRARWREIEAEVETIGVGQPLDASRFDLFFWGGGQDREQITVAADMQGPKGASLRAAIEDGVPLLAICGGYQLLGHYYRPFDSDDLPGISAIDVTSEAGRDRFIGNVVIETDEFGDLVGFENHSGLTFLGSEARPLGRVKVGHGNNGRDGMEGARQHNVVGCYMHGALLPKNPNLADWLISTALNRKYGAVTVPAVESRLEETAHTTVVSRAVRLGR
jgi:lipid II isoglutaminyl synthase (glutamine-hydrolysing)